jgi:hypothetical protein
LKKHPCVFLAWCTFFSQVFFIFHYDPSSWWSSPFSYSWWWSSSSFSLNHLILIPSNGHCDPCLILSILLFLFLTVVTMILFVTMLSLTHI